MAADINHVTLVGRLTRDIELRDAGEMKIGRIRLAVTSRQKKAGEWQDISNYFDVVVFGRTAENVGKYSGKGKRVGVTGRLSWREWTDKEGNKRQSVEVVANEVQFLEPAAAKHEAAPAAAMEQAVAAATEQFDGEQIPF